MSKAPRETKPDAEQLVFLKDLIARWYQACLVHLDEHPKLEEFPKTGDFLKMIDAYMKHAPEGKAQAELWKLIDRVRQQELPGAPAKKKTAPKSRRRKVA